MYWDGLSVLIQCPLLKWAFFIGLISEFTIELKKEMELI